MTIEEHVEEYLAEKVLGVSEVMHARYLQSVLLRARDELLRLTGQSAASEVPEGISEALMWEVGPDSGDWFTFVLDVVDAYRTLDRPTKNGMPRDLGDSLLRLQTALEVGGLH